MRCYDCSRQFFDFNRFFTSSVNTCGRQPSLETQCQAEADLGVCAGRRSGCCQNTLATNAINCNNCIERESCNTTAFAEFFALMPQDNLAPIAPGADIDFPHNGSCNGTAITRISGNSFNLAHIGTYQIMFVVSITEAGQLILTLNGGDLLYTASGKAVGASQITGMALVTTTARNSSLTLRNPAGNPIALTVTPFAGGTRQTSAHLVITQIA